MANAEETIIVMAIILCTFIGLYFLLNLIKQYIHRGQQGTQQTPPPVVVELSRYTIHNTDEDASSSSCPICMNHVPDVRFIACHHVLCNECAGKINHRCPFCRADLAV